MLYFQNEQLAKDEILAFFASHINAIKKIYEETVFQTYNQDVTYSAVTFAVQRTKVYHGMGNGFYQCSAISL